MEKIELFTDGACLGNPGPGGWAALLVVERDGQRHERELSGGEPQTTNNRMEMQAALEGLRALKRPCAVTLTTDSKYLIQGMTEWVEGWRKRGWKTASKKPVKNQEIWEALLDAVAPHEVRWVWVKGHAGHPENERVDELARSEAERVRR